MAPAAQRPAHLRAVDVGQHQVQHDEVGLPGRRSFDAEDGAPDKHNRTIRANREQFDCGFLFEDHDMIDPRRAQFYIGPMRRALLVTGVAALTLAGAANAADAEVPASPEAATAHSVPVAGNDAREVKCHVHTDKRRGHKYRVRKAPRTSAGVIIRYHGKKLLGWKHGASCPQVEGGTYRCAAGEPKDDQWLVVNYKGRKGYVAAACTGGIGA